MPSANKTEYGLNQWQGNEYPKREDFNTDNAIIDNQLKNVNDKADGKINKSLATAASQFLVSSAAGQWAVKTIAEVKTLLGLKGAAEKDFNTAGGVASFDTVALHLSDYVRQPGYAVTTGSANTYAVALTPAPAAYADGMGIVVKINAANTGAATINVNSLGAKAIVDGKGNALTSGKLRLNGTYSLKYNSTSGNFILQGSDSSGNATPADLLAGKTASTDAGDITGTMIDRSFAATGGAYTTAVAYRQDDAGKLCIRPQEGRYKDEANGYDFGPILINDPNFISTNIVAGKSIFGLAGTNVNKRWQTGTIEVVNGSLFVLSGLPFKPSKVFIEYRGGDAVGIISSTNDLYSSNAYAIMTTTMGIFRNISPMTNDGFSITNNPSFFSARTGTWGYWAYE